METIVIIPNYNGLPHLKECLPSLENQTYKKFKIIVVDDGSSDNSVEFLKNNHSQTEVLRLQANGGFANAVNAGINYATQTYSPIYIALLNNDTKIDQNWLKLLIESMDSEKNVASVASNMLFWDSPGVINSHGGMCNSIGIGKDINFGRKNLNINIQKYVLSSCFGATLLKADALSAIGLLDKRYFAYYEDLDWGMRANIFGYKIIFDERAIVYHRGSATFKNREYEKIYLCLRNSLCTIIKNYQLKNLLKSAPYCLSIIRNISWGI